MPEISLIVPVLNDDIPLRHLLDDLRRQKGADFEVIVCDGGSQQEPSSLLEEFQAFFTIHYIQTQAGRGRQMNAGSRQARGDLLVFLHADSRLPAEDSLAQGQEELQRLWQQKGHRRTAGHLSLSFTGKHQSGVGWYFYESKARSNRPLTTHGDQSFWLSQEFFRQLDGFEEGLPVLEDTRLAERVRHAGHWHLLTPRIETSPRRFDSEGLKERQTLNALIVAFDQIGWSDFFEVAPTLYRQQSHTDGLNLLPFWEWIHHQLQRVPRKERWRLWTETGRFVAGQFWQIPFWFQCRANYRRGIPPCGQSSSGVQHSENVMRLLLSNPVGHLLSTGGVFLWFYLRYGLLRLRRS